LYKSGEIIKTIGHQFLGLTYIYHYGIILVEGDQVYVLHNGRERGAIKDPIEEFLKDREIHSISHSNLEILSNKEILLRFEHCKSNWDVLNFNCEHFIDCMTNRNRNSEQLLKFIVFSTIVILLIKVKNE
tara:strand:- start:741 stop:1130 length:390 start_codon:yes stop_codon:yes gene_type:complete